MCWQETNGEYGFEEAYLLALGDRSGEYLMTVDQLRKFQELDHWSPTLTEDAYRVNGVFDESTGVWREYPSGEEINFKSYPMFDPTRGAEDGATLVWLPYENTFTIVSSNEEYPVLIFQDKYGVFDRCQGYPENECSGGGDCIEGECVCDYTFAGDYCEVVPNCPRNCNGYGTCDHSTGQCHCPGFKGPACEFCWTGLEHVANDVYDCFIISTEDMTFREAYDFCARMGIPMVEVFTPQDQENVMDKLMDRVGDDGWGWLGANNCGTPGVFTWIESGDTVGSSGYSNWKVGEPRGTDPGDDDDCVSINADNGEWHDTSCRRRNRAICQSRINLD